jgi:acyl-CoA synthetase (AMP-forming)/AMP-acid ligase II
MRIFDAFDFFAREYPETDFALGGGSRLTYGAAREETNRIAQALLSAGLQTGDRVAILAKNCAEYVLLYLGAARVGVAPVPLNYRLAPPEWSFLIQDSGAKLVIARGDLVGAIDPVRADLPEVEHWIALDADGRRGAHPAGWQVWSAWLKDRVSSAPDVYVEDDWDLYQMYTSGTTGRPKGAVLTHRAVTSNVIQLAMLPPLRLRPGDRYLIPAPMYHAAAAVACFFVMAQGGTLVIHEDFVPADVVRTLAEDGIVGATLVPAMIQACLVMVPDVAERRFDDLRYVIYGASPIAEETLRRALSVFGCEFTQGFGMTETTAALTVLLPADHERALRERPDLLLSAGRALPGTDVRVVDENDESVAPGTIGEIIGRGPQLMKGYWNMPEATSNALRGGWMHTGDAGVIDEDGYLYIQDRVKDMIVSGGENIYPREIEDVLFQHPAVADAAVIGVPDDKWGEAVHAVIVLRQGHSVSAAELMAHCRQHLGGFKVPRSADFIAALPRNPSGKVLKRELREPFWKGHSRRVS